MTMQDASLLTAGNKPNSQTTITTLDELNLHVESIKNLNPKRLTKVTFAFEDYGLLRDFDFSGYTLEEVVFEDQTTRYNKNVELVKLNFSKCCLIEVNFSEVGLTQCSFKDAGVTKCRLNNITIKACDFQYTIIKNSTFVNSGICHSDFYGAQFIGLNLFSNSRWCHCSLNYTVFENHCLMKSNLHIKNLKINPISYLWDKEFTYGSEPAPFIQESEQEFRLLLWKIRNENAEKITDEELENRVHWRCCEVAPVYRHFESLWSSRGFYKDASWAYQRAKILERKQLWNCLVNRKRPLPLLQCAVRLPKYLFSWFLGITCQYGTSIYRLSITLVIITCLFALIYHYSFPPNAETGFDINPWRIAILSAVGQQGNLGLGASYITCIQTFISILITGLLGFIMADRIRKS